MPAFLQIPIEQVAARQAELPADVVLDCPADTSTTNTGVAWGAAATGCPRATSIVLWTRMLGADLPERLPVAWDPATAAARK